MYIKLDKTTEEFKMMGEFYRIMEKFAGIEPDNDEYWNEFVVAAADFTTRYKDKFAADIMAAYIDRQERRARSFKNGSVSHNGISIKGV